MRTRIWMVAVLVLVGTAPAAQATQHIDDLEAITATLASAIIAANARNETVIPEEVEEIIRFLEENIEGAVCITGYGWQQLQDNSPGAWGQVRGVVTHASIGTGIGPSGGPKDPWVKTLDVRGVSPNDVPCTTGGGSGGPEAVATILYEPRGSGQPGGEDCFTSLRGMSCSGDWNRWASYN